MLILAYSSRFLSSLSFTVGAASDVGSFSSETGICFDGFVGEFCVVEIFWWWVAVTAAFFFDFHHRHV